MWFSHLIILFLTFYLCNSPTNLLYECDKLYFLSYYFFYTFVGIKSSYPSLPFLRSHFHSLVYSWFIHWLTPQIAATARVRPAQSPGARTLLGLGGKVPSSTAFPCTWIGSYTESGIVRSRSVVHMGWVPHRLWFNLLHQKWRSLLDFMQTMRLTDHVNVLVRDRELYI